MPASDSILPQTLVHASLVQVLVVIFRPRFLVYPLKMFDQEIGSLIKLRETSFCKISLVSKGSFSTTILAASLLKLPSKTDKRINVSCSSSEHFIRQVDGSIDILVTIGTF